MSETVAVVDHVQRTLDEAAFRIGQLQDLVKGLHLLREFTGGNGSGNGNGNDGKTAAEVATGTATVRVKKEGKGGLAGARPSKEKRVSKEGKGASAPTGIGQRVREVVDELVGEFDTERVAKELPDDEYESVRSALSYFVKKGELETVRRGWYRKAGTGTGGKPAKGKAEIPGKEERALLERKLEDALKQRDAARSTGRDTVAELFQAEVDKIEARLGR